ncbi:hypothetical protein [Sphingomonas sp. HMP9]|uniref:hypothetical protein n=1 Tax=Sphingomonas sp. HMP9 TaxID=1517554 RepID=UPI00159686B2|nr:hypothetical protein [Sphingomonas sp. HMP9]
MSDATIRTWVANHGLVLGDRHVRGEGNPRYDLSDCARLFMLHILTKKLRMDSKPAVYAVNSAVEKLTEIAEEETAAIDARRVPECQRYVMTMSAMSIDSETKPEITLYSDPQAIANRNDSRGLWCEVVIDLREIVRAARDALVNELGYSTSGLSHDFADTVSSEVRSEAA